MIDERSRERMLCVDVSCDSDGDGDGDGDGKKGERRSRLSWMEEGGKVTFI